MSDSTYTRTASSRLAWRAQRLAATPSAIGCDPGQQLLACYLRLLGSDVEQIPAFFPSALNNDGVPVQVAFSQGKERTGVRLLGDPAVSSSGATRIRDSLAICRREAARVGDRDLIAAVETSFAHLAPTTSGELAAYVDGAVWLGVPASGSGLALYVEAGPLGQAGGWNRAEAWLTQLLGKAKEDLAPVLGTLRERCVVASLGIEGRSLVDLRAKTYFRLAQRGPLSALGLPLLASPEVVSFLRIAMGNKSVGPDGLTMALGFSLATGKLEDVKVDLCAHCLRHSDQEWIEILDQCRDAFGLHPAPLASALATGYCEVAVAGFGLTNGGVPRVNTYLKARPAAGAPTRQEVAAAIDDGVQALVTLQHADGRFTDYLLPVGTANEWVTGYVGMRLAQVADQVHSRAARAAAERAADWLTDERSHSQGWGYNGLVESDADSTALVMALMRELGREVSDSDLQFLAGHWRAGGGFATFESGPNAWAAPHWDVTPLAYLALDPQTRERLEAEFTAFMGRERTQDRRFRSYWWRTGHYATLTTLEALAQLGWPTPCGIVSEDRAFESNLELACELGIAVLTEVASTRCADLARALLGQQRADGRWDGSPDLRVTDDACFEPWKNSAGAFYADESGTVTTATGLRTLALYMQTLPE